MRGYAGIERHLSACVHFVRNREVDEDSLSWLARKLESDGIRCVYVDYSRLKGSRQTILDGIGDCLELPNRPYGGNWIRFLDDLITISEFESGLVIVVDRADILFQEDKFIAFDLIESFLIQFEDWFVKKKPCHLCFQVEENPLVQRYFG